jgi:rubredoxin
MTTIRSECKECNGILVFGTYKCSACGITYQEPTSTSQRRSIMAKLEHKAELAQFAAALRDAAADFTRYAAEIEAHGWDAEWMGSHIALQAQGLIYDELFPGDLPIDDGKPEEPPIQAPCPECRSITKTHFSICSKGTPS